MPSAVRKALMPNLPNSGDSISTGWVIGVEATLRLGISSRILAAFSM